MTTKAEHVWGVDISVNRQAFAFASLDDPAIHCETLMTTTDAREGERLGLLGRQVRTYARQRAVDYPPAAVFVEQPSGRFRNLALVYVAGVIAAAIFEATGAPTWFLPSAAWKRRTVGAGNATKAQVAAWVAARTADIASQDEADAYAIAAAGRAMLTTRTWTATAHDHHHEVEDQREQQQHHHHDLEFACDRAARAALRP